MSKRHWWDEDGDETKASGVVPAAQAEYLNFGGQTRDALSKISSDAARLMNDQRFSHSGRERTAYKKLLVALRDAISAANEIHNLAVEGG